MTPGAKAYYAGGYRVIINGVPTRITHKPTANMLRAMRECPRYRMDANLINTKIPGARANGYRAGKDLYP